MAYVGQRAARPRGGVAAEEPPEEPSRLTPRLVAGQHNNPTWITSSARRAVAARYDWIMAAFAPGVSGISGHFDSIRAINPDVIISNYTQLDESRARGIYSITSAGGNDWTVTLDGRTDSDGTAPPAAVYGSSGNTVAIRGCATAAFNADHVIASPAYSGGRASFRITVVGGATEAAGTCLGGALLTSDGHVERFKLAAANGWFLRNVNDRYTSGGVDGSQRGINFTAYTTADGSGDRWPEVKAAHDKTYLFDPYQPTVGDPLVVWVDNVNPVLRTVAGDFDLDGVADNNTDTAVQAAIRTARVAYFTALRAEMPGVKIVGNCQSEGSGASSKTLNYAQYPTGAFIDGVLKENVYDGDATGSAEYGRSDNWLTLRTKLADERSRMIDVTLHAMHCAGGGATMALQNRDYQTACIGLAACLILTGDTMANTSGLNYTPQDHDVTGGSSGTTYSASNVYWHTEFSAELGDPLEAVPTAPKSGTTSIWVRFFDNGVVIANPNTTTDSFDDADLTAWQPAEHAGKSYRRMSISDNAYETVEANPFNTGAAVSGTISLTSHSACVLLLVP